MESYYLLVIILIPILLLSFFSKKLTTILLSVILIFFAGTRLNVDNDYYLYKYFFSTVKFGYEYFKVNYKNLELCIFFIVNSSRLFFSTQSDIINASFFSFALIAVSLKMYSIYKYSNFFILSTIFYVTSLYFMHELTTIRAGVSAGILLLMINDFEEENDKLFSIKLLISLIFHYSSILLIPLYIVLRFIKNIKYYYYILIASIIIGILKINILQLLFLDRVFPKIKAYIEMTDSMKIAKVNLFNFKILFSLFIFIIFCYNYKFFSKKKYFDVLFKIHIISIAIFYALSPTNIVFSLRSFELLSIIQIFLAPMLIYLFDLKSRWIGYAIVLGFSVIQLYYIISIQDIFKPYKSWFF